MSYKKAYDAFLKFDDFEYNNKRFLQECVSILNKITSYEEKDEFVTKIDPYLYINLEYNHPFRVIVVMAKESIKN